MKILILYYNMDTYDELRRACYYLGEYLHRLGKLIWTRVLIARIKLLR